MKYREKFSEKLKFNEKLKLLEQKMEGAVFFRAGELSLIEGMDNIMVSRLLLII